MCCVQGILVKSFIYIINESSPRMDPWGAPSLTTPSLNEIHLVCSLIVFIVCHKKGDLMEYWHSLMLCTTIL